MKVSVAVTVSHALGHWPCILPTPEIQVLRNRHQPCPACGGNGHFRFDGREGHGVWYYNQYGTNDGLELVGKVFGTSSSDTTAKMAAIVGNLPPADPTVMATTGAETDATRKNAAAPT